MITESCRSFSFERREWRPATRDGGKVASFEAPPGTWCKPWNDLPPDYAALTCCPNCKAVAAVSNLVHLIDRKGNVTLKDRSTGDAYECPHCKLRIKALLNGWGKQTLYAVAYEQTGKPGMQYMHANDQHDAKRQFRVSRPLVAIVAIGPVLGYYTETSDKDEKVLTVS